MDKNSTVLIVDDSPSNIQVLAECLKEKYHIKVATSGKQCLELSNVEQGPDLILLDIEMPGMNGYEVCQHLKASVSTESIPVIFVTGKDADQEEEKGLRLGAVDYITKPIRPAIVAARVEAHVTLKLQRDQLAKMAMHDQLTGLYNRHYLLETANHKVARALRHQYPLSLIMIDVDHFKQVNDIHGHPVGDVVLQAVAKSINKLNRSEDIVARFGGEELVVLLDQANVSMAENKAQKIRKMIEALKPSDISVTVSIGVAELHPGKDSFADLLKRADVAVYHAKEQGRNCVVVE